MQTEFCLLRTIACVLLFSFSASLIPASALAETSYPAAQTVNTAGTMDSKVDLSYQPELAPKTDGEKREEIIIAAQNKTDQQAVSSAQESSKHDCCGGFWEIHFGGYRWVWWALAGAGLIAIHASN
jgi:hypothetical protein